MLSSLPGFPPGPGDEAREGAREDEADPGRDPQIGMLIGIS